MSTEGRPLSPHLTIYRWPITMTLSIMHRMTGVALSAGLIAFVAWLAAIAYDAVPYEAIVGLAAGIPGKILFLGWAFSFFFHLCNGVRHLVWDTGRLFEKSQVEASAWLVLGAAVIMTAGFWLLVTGGA